MSVQNADRQLKTYKVAGATGTELIIGYQSAANTVAQATGTGVMAVGIIENNPATSSDVARVCYGGITKVHAGTGAIARGDKLTSDGRGYAVKTTATENSVGYAEEASTQDGQLIEIRVTPVKGS